MKKGYIILLIALCSVNVFAQSKDEKIKTLKIAFITEKLNLSKTEAQKFWPIYNAYEEDTNSLRNEMKAQRKSSDIDNLSETEANTLLNSMVQSNEKRLLLYNQYINDLKKVIPAKKIIILKKSEDDFRRKLFEEYKKRHQDDKR
ncbi:sensor of ECF-type sigma factor [Formosa sediminum]|uniref:Sensor of ECF-type sigma factor n=1 Tax=Formosa sediminum TaxID=2594004 RepID=A0A516GRH4_9FLAO|nr:sensor of ECF-type sigma factor [Formosa sediminum]QDO94121.1 sensor of ECF-type sigma factor [Formosa sediminum]